MDYDEWIFSSIKQYKNLSMYDVQQRVTAMDIVDGRSICVATTSGRRHELMELLLPDKMLETKQEGKLKKDRDFRVNCGWFSNSVVTAAKHLPNTRYCAVVEDNKRNSVTVLEMGSHETDLMKPYKSYTSVKKTEFPVQICPVQHEESQMAFGSSLDSVTVVDIHKEHSLADSSDCKDSDCMSSLHNQNSNTLVCCTIKGAISVLDLRCSKVKVTCHKNSGKPASFWTLSPPSDQSKSLLQLSSAGEVLCLDTRCPGENVVSKQLSLSTEKNCQNLMIQESPGSDIFSVSGFDGLVYLFNRPDLHNSAECLEPVFRHEGHVMESEDQSEAVKIVNHKWHPWQQNLVLSSADNGTIHAWQYNDKGPRL